MQQHYNRDLPCSTVCSLLQSYRRHPLVWGQRLRRQKRSYDDLLLVEILASSLCLFFGRAGVVMFVEDVFAHVCTIPDSSLGDTVGEEFSDATSTDRVRSNRRGTPVPLFVGIVVALDNVLPVGTLVRVDTGQLCPIEPCSECRLRRPPVSGCEQRLSPVFILDRGTVVFDVGREDIDRVLR